MTNRILCDRCNKELHPWKGEGIINLLLRLFTGRKTKTATFDLCTDCKVEFAEFMKLDVIQEKAE